VSVSWSAAKGQQKEIKEAEKKEAIVPPFRDASRRVAFWGFVWRRIRISFLFPVFIFPSQWYRYLVPTYTNIFAEGWLCCPSSKILLTYHTPIPMCQKKPRIILFYFLYFFLVYSIWKVHLHCVKFQRAFQNFKGLFYFSKCLMSCET